MISKLAGKLQTGVARLRGGRQFKILFSSAAHSSGLLQTCTGAATLPAGPAEREAAVACAKDGRLTDF